MYPVEELGHEYSSDRVMELLEGCVQECVSEHTLIALIC
jgi:hypothetical protein